MVVVVVVVDGVGFGVVIGILTMGVVVLGWTRIGFLLDPPAKPPPSLATSSPLFQRFAASPTLSQSGSGLGLVPDPASEDEEGDSLEEEARQA